LNIRTASPIVGLYVDDFKNKLIVLGLHLVDLAVRFKDRQTKRQIDRRIDKLTHTHVHTPGEGMRQRVVHIARKLSHGECEPRKGRNTYIIHSNLLGVQARRVKQVA
jgi:hypothetical protein